MTAFLRLTFRFFVWILLPWSAFRANGQSPQITISLPSDGMLLRANVPVFGTVKMPKGKEDQLKIWYLEYGPGSNPTAWVRLKESTETLSEDPWAAGQIKWDPNKEPQGNITNWAVGLQSYTYFMWKQNLNGMYTLRLVAESKSGKRAEIRQTHFIGEAIMRTVGGTALSADNRCRMLVPPFAFDGDLARVVCIIRQVPSTRFKINDLTGVEDSRPDASTIYDKLPSDLQLYSAIYRIYPNGMTTEPAAYLDINYDPKALEGLPIELDRQGITVRQYNPVTELWEALPTTWLASTARGEIKKVSDYYSYVALMKRSKPALFQQLEWQPRAPLSGFWIGRTEPFAEIEIRTGKRATSVEADSTGGFQVPYTLFNGLADYSIKVIPIEGEKFSSEVTRKLSPGLFTSLGKPAITVIPGNSKNEDYLFISCEDPALKPSDSNPLLRSTLLKVNGANRSGEVGIELIEDIPGSGIFMGKLKDSDLISATGKPLQKPLTLQAGMTQVQADMADVTPPQITLSSSTHPCLLFATVHDQRKLISSNIHSLARIQEEDEHWRITSVDNNPTARMTFWPVGPFSTESWPLIGFTYRLYEPTPWQLLLRQGNLIEAFHYGSNAGSPYRLNIPEFGRSDPLLADGKWHFWQGNLTSSKNKYISQVLFGAWKQTGFYRIDPGFLGKNAMPLSIRELFIGRTYPSSLVNVSWNISDSSAVRKLVWWTDQEADSKPPEVPKGDGLSDVILNPSFTMGVCKFELPGDGRWFFHMIAADASGNQSASKTYPLFIYGTQSVASSPPPSSAVSATPSSSPGTSPPPLPVDSENIAVWQLPEGSVQILLQGFGTAIDPKTFAIRFLDHEFPVVSPTWDAGREILTLATTSFPSGSPLGFDGEIVPMTIIARDFSGAIIPNLPTVKVRFESPLKWSQADSGGRINLVDPNPKDTWIAGWASLDAPWRERFPGSVNNLLMITQTYNDKLNRRLTRKWLRPIILESQQQQVPLYELESFANPLVEEVSSDMCSQFPVLQPDGTILPPVRQQMNPGERWIYRTDPVTTFDEGYVRVISRFQTELNIKRIRISELKNIIDFQQGETIRIDAWLPPGEGNLSFHADGNRRIFLGTSWQQTWEKVNGSDVAVLADDTEWKRIAILLVPRPDFKNPKSGRVSANVYW